MPAASQDVMVSFEKVEMGFGRKTPVKDLRKKVLDGVDLQLKRGEIVCLLGPSGCGKTTLVNLLMGNLVPDAGRVTVMGECAPYPTARGHVGYMPQDDALYDDITALDNLRFFGAMNGLKGARLTERAREMLAFGRLEADAKKLVSAFSGGMKRRLSLGIALMHAPDLLVLDEPTVGLDPDHRRHIWAHLEELAEAGCTILLTTHVMDEATRCSRIAMMHGGTIIADGSPDEIMAHAGAHDLESAFIALEESHA